MCVCMVTFDEIYLKTVLLIALRLFCQDLMQLIHRLISLIEVLKDRHTFYSLKSSQVVVAWAARHIM